MTAAFRTKLVLAAMLIGATSGSAQVNRSANMAVVVRPADAINHVNAVAIESQVARIPDSAVTKTVVAPAQPNPEPLAEAAATPAVQPKLDYLPAKTAELDVNAARALAGHADIRRLVGAQGDVIALPGFLRQTDQAGQELQLKMVVLAGKRLVFDSRLNDFVGTIWVGVSELVDGRPPQDLVTPVDFNILNATSADPTPARVTRTGAPGYKQIQLRLASAVGKPEVDITSNLSPQPFQLPLELNPALNASSDSPIDGFGLATSTISVTALGIDQPEGKTVTFLRSRGSGYLDPKQVQLKADGTATTELRSDGMTGATVVASTPGLPAVSTDVTYRLPIVTILASILGGIVGGLIRVGGSRMRGRRAFQAIGIAVLVGILVFALYAVGVNVLPITPVIKAGAIVVFVVSAVGAFIGPNILPKPA